MKYTLADNTIRSMGGRSIIFRDFCSKSVTARKKLCASTPLRSEKPKT